VTTEMIMTPAPAYFAVPRAQASTWVRPVQGIDMSGSAYLLGGIHATTGATKVTSANATKGATRKDAVGDEAFEDPV
jgi:hypothetical protein